VRPSSPVPVASATLFIPFVSPLLLQGTDIGRFSSIFLSRRQYTRSPSFSFSVVPLSAIPAPDGLRNHARTCKRGLPWVRKFFNRFKPYVAQSFPGIKRSDVFTRHPGVRASYGSFPSFLVAFFPVLGALIGCTAHIHNDDAVTSRRPACFIALFLCPRTFYLIYVLVRLLWSQDTALLLLDLHPFPFLLLEFRT